MERSELNPVKAATAEFARGTGFERHGSDWRRETDEVIQVLNLQASQYGPSYYVNLGYWLKALGENENPRVEECHAQVRLEELVENEGGDLKAAEAAFDLDQKLEAEERNRRIQALMSGYVLPAIERGGTAAGLRALHDEGQVVAVRGTALEALGLSP